MFLANTANDGMINVKYGCSEVRLSSPNMIRSGEIGLGSLDTRLC